MLPRRRFVIAFVFIVAVVAACSSGGGGGSGIPATGKIPCGSSVSTCDVSSNVCCVTSTAATCEPSCSNGGGFTCIEPSMCPSGAICCMTTNGSACRTTCEQGEKPACTQDSDCGDAGQLCGTIVLAGAGGVLSHIQVCGL